jgi:hypothetical protein
MCSIEIATREQPSILAPHNNATVPQHARGNLKQHAMLSMQRVIMLMAHNAHFFRVTRVVPNPHKPSGAIVRVVHP